MAVVPSISFEQSSDGKTLTLIDTSDYSTGNINSYSRAVELWSGINGTGTLLYSLPFTGTNLQVTQQLTSDRYFSAKLKFTGSPAVAPAYANFTTQQFEQNLLNERLAKDCGCSKGSGCDKSFNGFLYMYSAQVATLAGNSALANSFINASFKWLS